MATLQKRDLKGSYQPGKAKLANQPLAELIAEQRYAANAGNHMSDNIKLQTLFVVEGNP